MSMFLHRDQSNRRVMPSGVMSNMDVPADQTAGNELNATCGQNMHGMQVSNVPFATPDGSTVYGPTRRFAWQKARLRWSSELHEKFVLAVHLRGGPNEAKPAAILQSMERMGTYGLKIHQVKSHLQKYRNGLKAGTEQPVRATEEANQRAREEPQMMGATLAPLQVVADHGGHGATVPSINAHESIEDDGSWYVNHLKDQGCNMTVWEYINSIN